MITRRHFLSRSATAAAAMPFVVNRMPVGSLTGPLFNAIGSDPSDRVLVLINLTGGNDGLNSLVPLDQYDNLAVLRPNVVIPQNQLINLDATRALHPSLAGFRTVWDSGQLGIVQDIAYPDQNRSHFRSTDIWNTGSPSSETWTTGWLGRHFQLQHPDYPNGYPSEDNPDPIAIALGNAVSETCQGIAGNFSLTVNDPTDTSSILDSGMGSTPQRPYGFELEYIRQTIAQSNAYGDIVKSAAENASNTIAYPENNLFATQLSYVARMIAGGLRTKVYVVTLGGFDTHAAQVEGGDPTTGEHARLLQLLGDGVAAFQADINALGLGERVVGMTYSEFGRRIRDNAALGTDHGTAAPAFLFGDCINAGVLGDNPTIDRGVDDQEGVAMQFDFRDLYGSVLQDWFGVEETTVRDLLHDAYVRIPIIRECSGFVDTNEAASAKTDLAALPSVYRDRTQIRFATSGKGRVRLDAFDSRGGHLETLFERVLPQGEQTVSVDASAYPAGVVVYRLQEGARVKMVRTVRVR